MATRPVKGDGTIWQEWMAITLALKIDGDTIKDLATRIGMESSRLARIASGDQAAKGDDLYKIAAGQNRQISWYIKPPEPDPDKVRVMLAYRKRGKSLFNQRVELGYELPPELVTIPAVA